MSSWTCWVGPEELSGCPASPVCSATALRRALVGPPVLEQPSRAFSSSFVMQTFAFARQKDPLCVVPRLCDCCEGTLDNIWSLINRKDRGWEGGRPSPALTFAQSPGSSEKDIIHCCLVSLEEWHSQISWPAENCNYKSAQISKQSDSFLQGCFHSSCWIWYETSL